MHIQKTIKNYPRLHRRLRQKIYRKDAHFKDSIDPMLKLITNQKGSFARCSKQMPAAIVDEDGQPLATCVFIVADKMPDVFQIAFFEALPGCPGAADLLMDEAKKAAAEQGIERIVAGLNGHINYGLGYLENTRDLPVCFGAAYNPPYYLDYLRGHANAEHTLVSHTYDLESLHFKREYASMERIAKQFKIRTGNFNNLQAEVALYTELNNICFAEHPLYFERSAEEDYELFKSFGPFLKEENYLVAEVDGQAVGFLLWYPDFHELVRTGGKTGISALLKYRLLRKQISRCRLAEIGVLPEYQGSGVILGLIIKGFNIAKPHHTVCETGWILETNTKSQELAKRWNNRPYKTYKVFEIGLK